MFFIYLGFYYKNFVENRFNIFQPKLIGLIIVIQSLLWLYNFNQTPHFGIAIGLQYILAQGLFYNRIVPILTSITGIWISLFIVDIFAPYLKNNKLFEQIGKNTFHIMANHIFLLYLISNLFMWVNNLPEATRNQQIYWLYEPYKTVYFYLILVLLIFNFYWYGDNLFIK